MKNIAFVFSQSPHVHIGIVNQKFDTFDVVLQNGVVKGSVSLLTFEVDVVGVSDLF